MNLANAKVSFLIRASNYYTVKENISEGFNI